VRIEVINKDDLIEILTGIVERINHPTQRDWMSVEQLAEYLGCSKPTIYNWLKEGLPCVKKDGRPRFYRKDVNEWMREN
jgi:excisionase family DNA binding protein